MPAVAHVAQGRRAWRALRHDGDQGRASRRAAKARRRTVVLVPESAHGTNPATAACIGYHGARPSRRARTARSIVADVRGACSAPTSPRSCSPTPTPAACSSATVVEIARGGARGGRLLLLRRRQLQRHRRQGAARRSRRRRHAHQPAQDLLDARMAAAGRAPGPVVLSAALAPFAPLPFVRAERGRLSSWSSTPSDAGRRKPFGRMTRLPRPDGHVRARAAPTCCRTAPTACGRPPRTPCSTPTTSAPACRT